MLRHSRQGDRVRAREGVGWRRRLLIRIGAWLDGVRHRRRLRSWDPRKAQGQLGEDMAHRFLQRRGFVITGRNWRTRSGSGEADIIGWHHDQLVFVEVKTRRTDEFGAPEDAVDTEKRRKLLRAASEYVRRADVPQEKLRFDIVSVVLGEQARIVHHIGAFGPRRIVQ